MNAAKRAEWMLRHGVTYPLLKRVFRNELSIGTIDLRQIRSVLVLRYDRFGDMIVTSPITRQLKSLYPAMTVGLGASQANAEVARHLPGVDRVHEFTGNPFAVLSSMLRARRMHYDVVLNFILNRTTTGGILANVIVPNGVKVGQGDPKYSFYFNRMVSLQRGSMHMVNLLDMFCSDVFGTSWSPADLRYELNPDPESERRIDNALGMFSLQTATPLEKFVVLNITAGESRRNPSPDQIVYTAAALTRRYGWPVVLVGAPGSKNIIRSIRNLVRSDQLVEYPLSGSAPFMDIVSLIRRAAYLVSPDTSLVHVACAVGTPVVALYSSREEYAEWSPVGVPAEVLFDDNSKEVRTIPAQNIVSAFIRLHERVQRKRPD